MRKTPAWPGAGQIPSVRSGREKTGLSIDIQINSAPLDPDDSTRGVTITALDIPQHTRAERSLRDSEERFRKLIEISPDAVILFRDGTILYVNPAAQALLGASKPEEIEGKPVLDVISNGYRKVVHENIRKDLGGEVSPQMELQMPRLDGTSVTVEGRGAQTIINGKPAILVTVRDITARKWADEELTNSRQMLRLVL
ncbi:MAG: PAS domain S-box protein [Methanomicrobiales archaeon]